MSNKYQHIDIINHDGEAVRAISPVIISASWHTDIPALYSDWFFNRLNHGYLQWQNQRDGKYHYISFANTRFIVYWSKNPKPLLQYGDMLCNSNIGSYLHYTLNDYTKENYEPYLPSVDNRIDTFKRLSDMLGRERVIWRFDPLIINESITVNMLLDRISYIGEQIKDYTDKLVFSFVDVDRYKRVQHKIQRQNLSINDWSNDQMLYFVTQLSILNSQLLHLNLATCAEQIVFNNDLGIRHNKCIDPDLMKKISPNDEILHDYLAKIKKSSWQRPNCGCVPAKDIGRCNSCIHGCAYCYATDSTEVGVRNYQKHNRILDSLLPPKSN